VEWKITTMVASTVWCGIYQYNATSTILGWHKASPLFYSFVSHYHREGLEIMRSENYLGEGIFECLLTKKGLEHSFSSWNIHNVSCCPISGLLRLNCPVLFWANNRLVALSDGVYNLVPSEPNLVCLSSLHK